MRKDSIKGKTVLNNNIMYKLCFITYYLMKHSLYIYIYMMKHSLYMSICLFSYMKLNIPIMEGYGTY